MDSFYGAPRQPPRPPTINPIERIPTVPEVSVVENPFYGPSKNLNFCDYNATIRPQHKVNQSHIQNDSFTYNSQSMPKKHVHFKSSYQEPIFEKENIPQTLKTVPDLNGKTFKQIYMANVPDRHLDLSIFEAPRHDFNTSESQYDSVRNKDFDRSLPACNTDSTSSNEVTKLISKENTHFRPNYTHREPEYFNLSNYRKSQKPKFYDSNKAVTPPKCMEICTQTEPTTEKKCTEVATPNDEPTIKDLFKIIQQQNEQIMLLQRQVNNLKTNIRQPEIDALPRETPLDRPFMKELGNSPTKKGLFSFDVKATSFEFSFRPQQHKFRKQNDFLEPKIQEIVECDNSTDNRSNSLHLDESLDVKDSYVSNVPSIAIEMDEYQSSDEDEDPPIGLTFYKDLMSQVNKALKKAQKQSECQMAANQKQDLTGQTMNAVKQATLQHLRNIGVNLSPIQESSEITGGSELNMENCDQSEISCAVQQLLMKYLPTDKLAKVINKPKEHLPRLKDKKLKPPSTELSFATLQYMKKYNLIDNTKKLDKRAKRISEESPRILDVTALKLQPKLL